MSHPWRPTPSKAADGRVPCDLSIPAPAEAQLFFVGLVCCVGLLAAIASPMVFGETYTVNDLADFHIPMRAFYARCLASGHDFTWIPDVFCGFYLHGEGQVGMYHPLHYLLYAFLPFSAALNLEIFLSYPLMLAGMYFFLRRCRIRRDACLFAALSFAFSGFNMRHFVHINAVAVIAHIPWQLLAIDAVVRSRSFRATTSAIGLVALLTASQALLGYPQYLWLSLIAEMLYAAFLIPAATLRRFAWLFAAKLTGFFIGAVQIFPTLDVLKDSTRLDISPGFKYFFSLQWHILSQLVGPYLLSEDAIQWSPQEFGIYAGATVFVLLVSFLCLLRGLVLNRRLALAVLVMLFVSLDLAWGDRGFLGEFLMSIPIVGFFRAPVRHFLLAQFSISVAAALAFESLCNAAEKRTPIPWTRTAWLVAAPLLSVLALWYVGWPGSRSGRIPEGLPRFAASDVLVLCGPALVLAASLLVAAAARGARLAIAAIMVFAALDLAFYGLTYFWSAPVEPVASLAASARVLPPAQGYRVASASTPSNLWLLAGDRLLYGYAALSPKKRLRYNEIAALRVAGVKWLCREDCTGALDALQCEWVEVPDPLARARLLAKCIAAPRGSGITLGAVDIASTALIDVAVDLQDGPPGSAVIIEDDPGRMKILTNAPARRILVVSESFHEGWRARVDGQSCEVIRAYGDFIGCVVESGDHTVELSFAPASLRLGKTLSLLGLVALGLFFLLSPLADRRGFF